MDTATTAYTLTETQQQTLLKLTFKVADIIDDHISGGYLIPDELVNADHWDEINARKAAALEFIKANL